MRTIRRQLLDGFVLQGRFLRWLTWPLVQFPAGMYPFGRELDHIPEATLREMGR